MKKKVEILAPAGDIESFYAAINSGADAVYLGGKLFNARHYSENFNDNEMIDIIKYAHNKNSKVYVTLNILLRDLEIKKALEYAEFLYKADVDAVIIQDIGLIYLINKYLPDLKINISTQASVYDKHGINFFKDYNVGKFILARELNIEEIKDAAKNCNKEIEVFIHGALCMSYSGQCYYSSFLGGRSGNRGKCAQPCRLSYNFYDTNKGKIIKEFENIPLLSLKDYMCGKHISKLIEAGVTAFKIEGRMKRPEYVAIVVKYYKKLAESYLNGYESNLEIAELENKVKSVFSRGFTGGYLESYKPTDMFAKLSSGTKGKDINNIIDEVKDKVKRDSKDRRININFKINLFVGKPIILELSDGMNTITIYSEEIVEESINISISDSVIEEQLAKLGDTIFCADKIFINRDDNIYVKKSVLNKLRREAVEKLYERRGNIYNRPNNIYYINEEILKQIDKIKNCTNSRLISLKINNSNELEKIDLSQIGRIYIPYDLDIKINDKYKGEKYLWIPNIVSRDIYDKIKSNILKYEKMFDGVCVNNIGTFNFLKENSNLKIHCGYFMNLTNIWSVQMLKDKSANGYTFSIESNVKDIEYISSRTNNLTTEIVSYAYIQLMTMKNCPMSLLKKCKSFDKCSECNMYNRYNLIDRKGVKLNIKRNERLTKVYNSVPLSVLGKINKFNRCNIDYYYVDSNWIKDISIVIDTLYNELNNYIIEEDAKKYLLKENTFTRGHYFKNIF